MHSVGLSFIEKYLVPLRMIDISVGAEIMPNVPPSKSSNKQRRRKPTPFFLTYFCFLGIDPFFFPISWPIYWIVIALARVVYKLGDK